MKEFEIMRGFLIPNDQRSFMLVDDRTIRTTEPGESAVFREVIPSYIGRAHNGKAEITTDDLGEVSVQASREAIEDVRAILRTKNFPERKADYVRFQK